MRLYFLRHGKAAAAADSDFSRPLTAEGAAEMKAESRALEALGVNPDWILTSPLVRARETAEIVAARLGAEDLVKETELLQPGCTLPRLQQLLGKYGGSNSLMLVGHEPDFSRLIGELVGPEGATVEMKKAGLALVEIEGSIERGQAVLRWLLPPKVLRCCTGS